MSKRTTIHVMTPCSRPENLERVALSIARALPRDGTPVQWWVVIDARIVKASDAIAIQQQSHEPPTFEGWWTAKAGIAGHQARNQVLDRLMKDGATGHICWLDDDTTMVEGFIAAVAERTEARPDVALMVDQYQGDTLRLRAAAENMRVASCDTGQGVIPLDLIGNLRFDDHYEADGRFYAALHQRAPERFEFVNRRLSLYNALRG